MNAHWPFAFILVSAFLVPVPAAAQVAQVAPAGTVDPVAEQAIAHAEAVPSAPIPAPSPGPIADPNAAPHDVAALDHASHATHEGHAGPAAIRWLPSDEGTGVPYAYMLVNFAVLLAIYVKVGKKPAADALEKRRTDYLTKVENADRLRREAEARAEKYQLKLATLTQDLAEARAALDASAKAEHARIIAEAHERAERLKRDAAFIVAQEGRSLRDELQRKTVAAAIDAAATILAENVNVADQERLAESFLNSLSATPLSREASQS